MGCDEACWVLFGRFVGFDGRVSNWGEGSGGVHVLVGFFIYPSKGSFQLYS